MKTIRTILACIRKADQKYNLINHGDKIVIGLSGGKDSLCLLYALTLYQKFSHTDFIIQPVTLDLGFPGFDAKPLIDYCASINLSLIVHDAHEVYQILEKNKGVDKHLPCSICSRMKKAAINKVANELGYNKVAFAHHGDDAIETYFMNTLLGGRIATFSPKMYLENSHITFIRPLILCRENDILRLTKEESLPVLESHCPADKTTTREEMKDLLKNIYHHFPPAKKNLLTMLDNYQKEDVWGKELYYQIDACGLTLKPIITAQDAINSLNIRYQVFVKEKGVSYEEEVDQKTEFISNSFLIYLKDQPIGTIRYRFINQKTIKIERFAILNEYRHLGYGKKVFAYFLEMLWKEYNPVTFVLHSMVDAQEFYLKFGFKIQKKPFLEAGIWHIELIKE